jgi:Family of unknown function (DUF6065)
LQPVFDISTKGVTVQNLVADPHGPISSNCNRAEIELKRKMSLILEAYAIHESPQPLAPAPAERDWMKEFVGRHAYRCLPVAIGNTYGWQLLLPVDVTAEWNGGPGVSDITILCSHPHEAISHFQCGVLTFDVAYIFRTPPDYHLLVTGPTNVIKDGVAPMTALVESDWLPYPFTFNYRFTRPCKVTWKAGEPLCTDMRCASKSSAERTARDPSPERQPAVDCRSHGLAKTQIRSSGLPTSQRSL